MRLVAIAAVIMMHIPPFADRALESATYYHLCVILTQLGRFAVPFFFVISGFFWGLKIRSGNRPFHTTRKMAIRIAIIFLAWSVIYLLPYNLSPFVNHGLLGPFKLAQQRALALLEDPCLLLFQGTRGHLWFLIGLLDALVIAFIFIKLKAERALYVVAVVLYLLGILLKAYADTPIGFTIHFDTRNGPFFSTLLFSTGYFLSGKRVGERWFSYGLTAFVAGCLLHFTEIYTLNHFFGTSLLQNYVFGTYFMGVGIALVALSNHPLLRLGPLSNYGKLTLGIYVIHPLFVENLRPLVKATHVFLWEFVCIGAVLMASIIAIQIVSKSRLLRHIVS